VQCSAVQYSAVPYSAVSYSTVQCSAVQYSAVQYSAVQYSAVQCSAVYQYCDQITSAAVYCSPGFLFTVVCGVLSRVLCCVLLCLSYMLQTLSCVLLN
jgi:hypothetical protein